MANKIYLISGHTSSGKLKSIDRRVLSSSNNGKILVLNLTLLDSEILNSKREFFGHYFKELGANEV